MIRIRHGSGRIAKFGIWCTPTNTVCQGCAQDLPSRGRDRGVLARDRGVCQPVRGETETEAFKPEAEALGDRSEAETEANNKKMCIFKLFKTWKLFEMYNLTWNGIIC